jgi:hypothetical protein
MATYTGTQTLLDTEFIPYIASIASGSGTGGNGVTVLQVPTTEFWEVQIQYIQITGGSSFSVVTLAVTLPGTNTTSVVMYSVNNATLTKNIFNPEAVQLPLLIGPNQRLRLTKSGTSVAGITMYAVVKKYRKPS